MKPELLLLAKMYSELISVSHKTFETTIAIYFEALKLPEEKAQLFLEKMVLERESVGLDILRVLIENLRKEFPDCVQNDISTEELIRRISPAFPGKPSSPYKEGFN